MLNRGRLIEVAHIRSPNTFTLPKKVRDILNIDLDSRTRSLSYTEEANGEISIGKGGASVIETSLISSSFQVTLKKLVRKRLEAKEGDTLGFYEVENKVFIRLEE